MGAFLASTVAMALLAGGPWLAGTSAGAQDLQAGVGDGPREVSVTETRIVEQAFNRSAPSDLEPRDAAERDRLEHYNPPRLRAFFEGFDADGDGELDPREAVAFYGWIEDNVTYRHDDEHAEPEVPGTPVGDGREGHDYQQSPLETFDERMGDCEDTSTLLVAFHHYWGAGAYQALVNTEPGEGVSHATAIVHVEDPRRFPEPEEGFQTYTFEPDNEHGVQAGTYLVADNTYSDAFGTITGDLEPGTFEIHDVETLADSVQRSDDWRG